MRSYRLQYSLVIWAASLIIAASGFLTCSTTTTTTTTPRSLLRLSSTTTTTTTAAADNDGPQDFVSSDTCDVAIFGGGFGGLYTALAMARELQRQNASNNRRRGGGGTTTNNGRQLDIALVTPGDNFVFLPLLYDLTMGTASEMEVCPTYKSILAGTGIRHVKATLDDLEGPDGYSARLSTCSKTTTTTTTKTSKSRLSFRASVMAVGATPQSILESVPGANKYTQPYYTKEHAKETDTLLKQLEQNLENPRIAVVGGGYGGVELATCVKRRIPNSHVCLLTRGPPMKGTRAEALIDAALKRLEVNVRECSVEAVEPVESETEGGRSQQVMVKMGPPPGSSVTNEDEDGDTNSDDQTELPWDAVLWTAGSGPAYPIVEGLGQLSKVEPSGRLSVDDTLRCHWKDERPGLRNSPRVWAMGDCAEIDTTSGKYATPKTAQAAMQQADVVANNILVELGMLRSGSTSRSAIKTFTYQDLGTMLTLGGPNAAVFAPPEDAPLAPLLAPAIDIARVGFGIADGILGDLLLKNSKKKDSSSASSGGGAKKTTPDLGETVENLGLSLGGYGLGVDPNAAPAGTLAGTLSGAARRAVYALRMPTNRQRIYAATSAAISTATALAKEANALNEGKGKTNKTQ